MPISEVFTRPHARRRTVTDRRGASSRAAPNSNTIYRIGSAPRGGVVLSAVREAPAEGSHVPTGPNASRDASTQRTAVWRWLSRIVVWGSLLLAWFITARIKGPVFLPTPFATAKGLGKLVTEGYVPTIAGSLRQLFAGFAIAVAVGVPTGLLMGSVRAADDFLSPYVNTLFIVSKEALLPLFIVLFGTHFIFRVAVVFFFSILFIVLNTAAGVRSVDSRLIETARAFRLPRGQIFIKVILPGTLPFVIAGLRLGLSAAIKGMVIAELWVTIGIGLLLTNFGGFLRLDLFYALGIVIVAVGVVCTSALRYVEYRLRGWARTAA